MSTEREVWLKQLEEARARRQQHYASEQFAEGDKLKSVIDELERHARSRGWIVSEPLRRKRPS